MKVAESLHYYYVFTKYYNSLIKWMKKERPFVVKSRWQNSIKSYKGAIYDYVGIYIYKDRISFVNHNRPLPPVTIEAFNRDRSFDRLQYLNKELKDMFFSLNLIESYGSGIRRAKDALLENGSPELKFYPDNEEDNYTNAVMGINSEFLKVFNGSTTQETTQEIKIEKSVSNRIIELMMMEPNITAKQIAEHLNVSFDGVRYHIKKLRADGKIKREGSTKSGKWVVMK